MRPAAPLAPSDRRLFLWAVADALQDVAELGDGVVSRVCADSNDVGSRRPPAGIRAGGHWSSVECQRHVKHRAREGRRARKYAAPKRVVAGGKRIEVARVRITEAGRRVHATTAHHLATAIAHPSGTITRPK